MELQYINKLLAKAMQDGDSERVEELRDQMPRAYNKALEDRSKSYHAKIHAEFSLLDRKYFDYCETQYPLPDLAYTNQQHTGKHTGHSTLSE